MFELISGALTMRQGASSPHTQPYEWFTITANPDGTRTLRVITKSPDASLVRDVSQTVDETWAPVDGYVRLIRDGSLEGSLVRRVEGDLVHSIHFDPSGRVSSEERELADGLVFGFHAVASNPWKFGRHSGGAGPERLPILTQSLTWNGGTVGLGEISVTELELVGTETVTVPAGTFECDHFRWSTPVDGVIEVWGSTEHKVYVRGHQHSRDIVYELDSLSRAGF